MTARIINILSIVILTISAVAGLLFDFKDKDGHLTSWGIAALVITTISGLTAIVSQILEFRKEKEEEKLEKVREQERKVVLSEIQSNIISSNSPLIPFRLLYTLKYHAKTSDIEDAVSNSVAIKSIVKSRLLKLVGTAILSAEPFNSEQESPEKLHCTINDQNSLDNLMGKQKLLKLPNKIEIEIYTSDTHKSPDIIFSTEYETKFGVGKINEVRIYDNIVYQDTISQQWEMTTSQLKVFGIRDLLRSRIKVKASFFISDRTNDKDYPRFTNLLLYFGDNPTNLLSFKLDELLSKQTSGRESENDSFFKFGDDLAKQLFQRQILEFEINITDEIFNNQIKQFV
jgi:hypothetical protein